jgi:hypothetical protein
LAAALIVPKPLRSAANDLAPTLSDQADLHLAFGGLLRIMLLEQIYRNVTILSGHPYTGSDGAYAAAALATGILRGRQETSARITAAEADRT